MESDWSVQRSSTTVKQEKPLSVQYWDAINLVLAEVLAE
jgi:hypothetical protein